MKVVFRASDIGFSPIFDKGALEAIENGIISSANVMVESDSAIESLKKLRDMPWISLEWHRNLWERATLSPKEIPSMVNEDGFFKWGHDKRSPLRNLVKYDEAYNEFVAEVEIFKTYAGRYPVSTWTYTFDNDMEKAFKDVCERYNIKINPYKDPYLPQPKEFENLQYYMIVLHPDMLDSKQRHGYDLMYYDEYDPIEMIKRYPMKNDVDYMIAMHPGFVDHHVATHSSMRLHRIKEYEFAISEKTREWIKKEKIEIVNQKDMLLGTNDYQQHLKEIGSDLYIGNMR